MHIPIQSTPDRLTETHKHMHAVAQTRSVHLSSHPHYSTQHKHTVQQASMHAQTQNTVKDTYMHAPTNHLLFYHTRFPFSPLSIPFFIHILT